MCVRLIAVAAAVAGITACGMKKCCELSKKGSYLSFKDRLFLKKAVRAGICEIQTARLAMATSEDREIRSFAQVMLQEHRALDNELKSLARSKGVGLATSAGILQQETLAELKRSEGAAFDALYIKYTVDAHEKAIELFKSQADRGSDEELRGFAHDVLELLEDHLHHAHLLQRQAQSGSEPTP